jgi:hypothetical protein
MMLKWQRWVCTGRPPYGSVGIGDFKITFIGLSGVITSSMHLSNSHRISRHELCASTPRAPLGLYLTAHGII